MITDWFLKLFSKNKSIKLDGMYGELENVIIYKELAIQTAINLISNTVARSEFITYEESKEVRKQNYYLLNVEPNQNKSSSKFWRDVVSKLIYKNKCLVVQINNCLYVADEFSIEKRALIDNVYTDISIGEYPLKDKFRESEVLHFELHNEKIAKIIDAIYKDYSKLIQASMTNYKKNNARRGTLNIPTNYPVSEKAQKDLDDLFKNKFKRFFEAEGGAVLPLTNGLKYDELESNIGAKSSSVEGRDIRAFVNDIFDYVAIAFQIPPSILKGDKVITNDAMNNYLTFCINPIAELLTDEINRKMYGKKLFLENTYAKLDTSRIKVVDLKDISNALDVLTRIGAYTIDDSLKVLGKEPTGENFGKVRWMTKNYSPVEEMLKGDD